MSDVYVGGERLFLVDKAIYDFIHDGLEELNWFSTSRPFAPVKLIADGVEVSEDMEDNVVALSSEDSVGWAVEMGSSLSEKRRQFYVDVYAKNLSIAKRLAADIEALLEFRFNFQQKDRVDVVDIAAATPSAIFSVDIEDVVSDRSRFYEKTFKRFWYQIAFDVVDYYGKQE